MSDFKNTLLGGKTEEGWVFLEPKELHNIAMRAQRCAEVEAVNSAEAAMRGPAARAWMKLSDAAWALYAHTTHARLVRFQDQPPSGWADGFGCGSDMVDE